MGEKSSLVSGFHKLSLGDRRKVCSGIWDLLSRAEKVLFGDVISYDASSLSKAEEAGLYHTRPFNPESVGENPIGTYEKAMRAVPNLKINRIDYMAPFVTEEASVVAGLTNSAKLAYQAGGVEVKVVRSFALGQVLLYDLEDAESTMKKILDGKQTHMNRVNEGQKHSKATDISVRKYLRESQYSGPFCGDEIGEDRFSLVIDLEFDPADAMGAAKASEMTERIADDFAREFKCSYVGRVVSNASGRLTRAKVRMPVSSQERVLKKYSLKGDYLGEDRWSGQEVSERISLLSEWAENDSERAVTNNKGIMNGVIGIAEATAQDTRAIEAACHHRASREGAYKPLSRWHLDKEYLVGEAELLLPVGIVGGEIKKYPKAEVVLKDCLKVQSANELAEIMAAVGLLQNHAALSMLSTIGVCKGHGVFSKKI